MHKCHAQGVSYNERGKMLSYYLSRKWSKRLPPCELDLSPGLLGASLAKHAPPMGAKFKRFSGGHNGILL